MFSSLVALGQDIKCSERNVLMPCCLMSYSWHCHSVNTNNTAYKNGNAQPAKFNCFPVLRVLWSTHDSDNLQLKSGSVSRNENRFLAPLHNHKLFHWNNNSRSKDNCFNTHANDRYQPSLLCTLSSVSCITASATATSFKVQTWEIKSHILILSYAGDLKKKPNNRQTRRLKQSTFKRNSEDMVDTM